MTLFFFFFGLQNYNNFASFSLAQFDFPHLSGFVARKDSFQYLSTVAAVTQELRGVWRLSSR